MMELIRNCSHGNDTAVYIRKCPDFSGKEVVKVSSEEDGMRCLLNEVDGWSWYQRLRYPGQNVPYCRIIRSSAGYLKTGTRFIEGNKPDYRKGVARNSGVIEQVIRHYCRVWGMENKERCAMHGDLSLDNIVLNSSGVNILDWEHFCPEAAPWGFDILYFLFECLWFGVRRSGRIPRTDLDVLKRNVEYLGCANMIPEARLKRPLAFVREFIRVNKGLWGEQLVRFPDKFPVIKFTDDQVSEIERMIAG